MADNLASNLTGLFDNGVNFGFGLFAYSRDKIEQMVEKMVEAGKVERKDAQSFAHQMIQTGEQQRQEVDQMVKNQVKTQLEDLGLTNNDQSKPLTAEDVRQIVKEELAASKDGPAK